MRLVPSSRPNRVDPFADDQEYGIPLIRKGRPKRTRASDRWPEPTRKPLKKRRVRCDESTSDESASDDEVQTSNCIGTSFD